MRYLGKEINEKDLIPADVSYKISSMKNRSDLHEILGHYNWKTFWKIFDARITDKLTWKQFNKIHFISSIDGKIKAIKKVSKSEKIHNALYDLELFAYKIELFQKNINKNFGFDGDTERFNSENFKY